ncbi:MAG: hypothetical protein OJF49_004636 [Ktedonobacterales bacterium]|jgi:GNAT superfamily N-acetyltransferase|nr:MAG: hypothetical protein OJF49_004636 [Ktedonobacterales bacterium]
MVQISHAEKPERIAIVCQLLSEHIATPGILAFDAELASLPGAYGPPHGRLLLALVDEQPAGCVALRPQADSALCEMKRLYVRPAYRGQQVGRALVIAIIAEARALGYQRMRLDTLPALRAAVHLYRASGFYGIPPYHAVPIPGAIYMELDLTRPPDATRSPRYDHAG